MKILRSSFSSLLALLISTCAFSLAEAAGFRPPAVPLVVSDPYLSIWSESNLLTGDVTRHWTRQPQELTSLVRIDGRPFRLMGLSPAAVPPLPQTAVVVFPTRSIYTFAGAGIQLTLTFMTPVLPENLDILTRPVTYISWTAKAVDGKSHDVSVYFDAAPDVAVNTVDEPVIVSKVEAPNLCVLRVGTSGQPILGTAGDGTRIDWGYFYACAPSNESPSWAIADGEVAQSQFASTGTLPTTESDISAAKSPQDNAPHLALSVNLGHVGSTAVSRYVMVAYDEIYSINYFWEYLRPYWRRSGATPVSLLTAAAHDYPNLTTRCQVFDHALIADLTTQGGQGYAEIGSLAYRQAFGGAGIAADSAGKPLLFTKEDTSNGDIATVDVIFPANPIFLLFSPTLAKASLVANLDYAASKHWKFPNAPHDLGTYPDALGRDDGGEAMPVEESGNIIILCDAIAQEEGSPEFVSKWWPELTKWTQFLEQYGFDPGNQLCTDDFMGPSPHNANLSVKAIVALGAYADLCKRRGDLKDSEAYFRIARADAAHWIQTCDTGDHSLLAFGSAGTWSEKYNLVWDRALGLNIFPPTVAAKEVAYYKTTLQPYGAPLDSRTKITETPWTYWSAALSSNKSDFEYITDPLVRYMNETTTRDPLSDSFSSDNVDSGGMHARPVVGGVFIQMLENRSIWAKWAGKDPVHVDSWAPFPNLVLAPIADASDATPQTWRVTTNSPGPTDDWTGANFNDSAWTLSEGAFGDDTPFPVLIQTMWSSSDLWARRLVDIPEKTDLSKLRAWILLDGQGEFYVNGVAAFTSSGSRQAAYALRSLSVDALAAIKPGPNTISFHVSRTGDRGSPQAADFGLVSLVQGSN